MSIKSAAAGAALAMAAASLFAVWPLRYKPQTPPMHCYGVTSCKGMNDCKTKDHAQGPGRVQRMGFKAMTKSACDAAGGKVGE